VTTGYFECPLVKKAFKSNVLHRFMQGFLCLVVGLGLLKAWSVEVPF